MDTMNDETILLPCPFCGGEAELTGFDAPEFWVWCPNCKASTDAHTCKGGAIEAWNTRAERTCEVLGEDYDELLDYWETELSCGHVYIGMKQYVNYCPNCGAKVVSE